ncbi:MAG: hypothetical protein OHK0022_60430 [Roseiflexaceae bacterium]
MRKASLIGLLALTLTLGACGSQTGGVPAAPTAPAATAPAAPTSAPATPAPTAAPPPTAAPAPTAGPAPATSTADGSETSAAATCAALNAPLAQRLGTQVDQSTAPVEDVVRGVTLEGCRLTTGGTGAQFADFLTVSRQIEALLAEQGFRPDPNYLADGPTGTGAGYRKEGLLALSLVEWQPGPGAFCPQDQPIMECNVPPDQQIYTIRLSIADDRLGSEDDAIKQAAYTYVMENTEVRGFLVVLDRIAGDTARGRVLPDDRNTVDPAFVFLRRTGDYWSVISLGTAFGEDFYTSNKIPDELRIGR